MKKVIVYTFAALAIVAILPAHTLAANSAVTPRPIHKVIPPKPTATTGVHQHRVILDPK